MIRMFFTFKGHAMSLKRRGGEDWNVIICDNQTGEEKEYTWDDRLLSDVMCLIGGSTYETKVQDYMFAITEIIDGNRAVSTSESSPN